MPASAKLFYVAQNSTRTTGGTSCATALSVAWFNNPLSWGSASNQISPDTVVHLCGTFRGTPGQQLLKAHGSGWAGHPITIKFETGANLSAPYWSNQGAINIERVSYITIDGGANGVIQNTDNGTTRHYHQQSKGIRAAFCTGCTVKNLTIQNLYVRTSPTDLSVSQETTCVYGHESNYFTVSHITCHDAVWAVIADGNRFTLDTSNLYRVDHGLASGPAHQVGGYSIHDNHFHDTANWDSPNNYYHHDGIHMWGKNGGAITSGSIYNNTFDGDFGVNITAHIFLQDSIRNVHVYNNTTRTPAYRNMISVWFYAPSTSLPGGNATGNSAYNNSLNAGGHKSGSAIYATGQFQFTAVNNVLSGGSSNISIQGGGTRSSTGVNHNVYRDLFAEIGDLNVFGFQGKSYHALPTWRTACHCDASSTVVTSAQTTAFSATNTVDAPTVYSGTVGLTRTAAAEAVSETISETGSAEVTPAGAEVTLARAAEPSESPESENEAMDYLATLGVGQGLNLSEIAKDDLAPLAMDKNGVARPISGPWNIGPQ